MLKEMKSLTTKPQGYKKDVLHLLKLVQVSEMLTGILYHYTFISQSEHKSKIQSLLKAFHRH